MADEKNTQPSKPTTVGPDQPKASPPQAVDTPVQPSEDVDFDENLDPDLEESKADFDAEEQNPKETTA